MKQKLKNKKILSIIFFVIFIIIILFLILFFNSEEETINNEIIPEEEITDEQLRETNISLFFINKETGEIEKESRRIDSKKLLENPYEEIINLWIKGPTNNNLINGISENVKLNKININKNCAIVDLSEEFLEINNNEKIDNLKVIYCIVNSLTELTEVDRIKIIINGEENKYLGNINLSEEYCRIN